MAFVRRLLALGRNESGNALAICAAALPILIGGAGLAIDTVQISLARRELQRAADSAALAGAYAINQNPAATGAIRAGFASDGVARDLALNNDFALSGAPVVENAPTVGNFANNPNAVRVQLSGRRVLSFFSFFDIAPQEIRVDATAAIINEGEFCLLALENGNDPGVTVGGNAEINVGCGISTNSRSASAISAGGSSSVTATPIMAVGGVPPSGNFGSATLIPYSSVQADPFANLPTPNPTNCQAAPESQPNSAAINVSASTTGYNASDKSICYNGLNISGAMNFNFAEPTVVYINGTLDFGSKAAVTATNATFVITSTNATSNPESIGTIEMNAQANINITSPSTGPYAGVGIYLDRRAPIGRDVHWNGGADMIVNGALYMPSAFFRYNGNATMKNQCIQLIARRLDFRGNGRVTNTCARGGPTQNFQATFVRVVE